MKKILLAALIILVLASNAFATAQAQKTHGRNSYGIVCTGDADYTFPAGYVEWIQFKPSAASDKVCIRDVSSAGPILMYATSIDGSNLIVYVGGYCTPYFVYASSTIGTGANYEVTVFYQK